MSVSRNALLKAIETRLAGLPVTTPPTNGYVEKPTDVPTLDGTGHVQRYYVLHPWWGTPSSETDLGERFTDLEWTFQVTVAAGFKRDCLALAYGVDDLLFRWTPQVSGAGLDALRVPFGYDPGPPREDPDVTPSRWWLPLQYRTRVHPHI